MSTWAIIQARMGSTRFPEKVVADLHGLPMIIHVYRRMAAVMPTAVAVPGGIRNRDLCDLLSEYGAGYIYVDNVAEDNVLGRYYEAVTHLQVDLGYKVETIVRVTGDCPLIHPGLVVAVAQRGWEVPYVSNFHKGRTWPRGLDVEAFSYSLLKRTYLEALDPYDCEHVTPYMHRQPVTDCLKSDINRGHWRWTVDTPEDLEWMRRLPLMEWKPPRPTYAELVNLIDANPNLLRVDPR